MANPILISNRTLTGASVATPLATSRLAANNIIIQANKGNSASVFIGDSTVLPGTGLELAAGELLSMTASPEPNGINLASIYFVSASSGALVTVLGWEG